MRKTLFSVLTIIVLSGCSVDDFFGSKVTQYIAVREMKVISITGMSDVEWARKKGASDGQIAEYLASTRNYRLKEALGAGVPLQEIIKYLAPQPKVGSIKIEEREVRTGWILHKIVYKVYADKQDIVYWIETKDSKERLPLCRVRNCIIADSDNWQGEMDYSFWAIPRWVETVDGKLKLDYLELPKVGWWKWNFNKESFQGSEIISTTWFVWKNNLVWVLSTIGILLIILYGWHSDIEDKKRKRQEAEQAKREEEEESDST